ncbi:tyrosine--tRNA ligase [Ureaplasma ceti]|uniref:Tyrosine--tRNA ligase n=1 Tax=Ureaplasma ceti TaxID=3119530 RepID=A0ABP9U6I0_9BACT
MNILDDLKWRGILNAITNEEKFAEVLNQHKCAYVGFDPSASSLHLGNYVMLMMVRRLNQAGIKTYAMVGGATGMIGDPSGKSAERNLLNAETVEFNKQAIIRQLKKYATEDVLDNYEHFKNMSFLTFLRDVGKMVSINYLLEKEVIKTRLESSGLSYTEFSYNLIQSYDFLTYYQNYNVALQVGGSDQWGNITAGIEMIRKTVGDENIACGMTMNLLTNSEGKKFGKSEKGAIFLDPSLTSPYEMYQFLINQPDSEVIKLLKFLTLLSHDEITAIEAAHLAEPAKRIAQTKLAEFVVTDIHGADVYNRVQEISKILFSGDIKSLSLAELKSAMQNVPSEVIEAEEINIVDLLVALNVVTSKTKARELVSNNSIMINGDKVNDLEFMVKKADAFNQEFTVVKKGKKNYFVASFK